NNDPDRKFKKVEFGLPTRKQFIAAATGGKGPRIFSFEGNEIFTKKGPKLNIDNRKSLEVDVDKAWCKVNFRPAKNEYADGAYYTAKTISFEPNEYGIYNLCGNVEEFIAEYGFVKGGSWQDLLSDATLITEQPYTPATEKSAQRGFRFVMRIIEQ
ncbi:MAG TPA: SUMF1/EgtB/PvdO family nonheme iron enzyme, partial [Flavobacteriales bacterium]|nr:SUMF1/EgtB/PvdO family nonheme iron enzyme [Flavobacteriales bacterium]